MGFIHEIGVVLYFLSLNPLFLDISACKSTTFFGRMQEICKTFLEKVERFLLLTKVQRKLRQTMPSPPSGFKSRSRQLSLIFEKGSIMFHSQLLEHLKNAQD